MACHWCSCCACCCMRVERLVYLKADRAKAAASGQPPTEQHEEEAAGLADIETAAPRAAASLLELEPEHPKCHALAANVSKGREERRQSFCTPSSWRNNTPTVERHALGCLRWSVLQIANSNAANVNCRIQCKWQVAS